MTGRSTPVSGQKKHLTTEDTESTEEDEGQNREEPRVARSNSLFFSFAKMLCALRGEKSPRIWNAPGTRLPLTPTADSPIVDSMNCYVAVPDAWSIAMRMRGLPWSESFRRWRLALE